MDAITDPTVERVSWMKSARVGATKILNATIGYFMHQDPCPIMVVQPTVDDAEKYSKDEVAPMLRDCPELAAKVAPSKSRTTGNTILHKEFEGGRLILVGANSASGFRARTVRVIQFDEVDGYPPSAGQEGDQIRLGIMRTETFWNRKIIATSTPLIAGASRIEELFLAGDQRRYHVPCPHCDYGDILTFSEGDRGHWMQWPKGEPEKAYFVCRNNGCVIEHQYKRQMVEQGLWKPDADFHGHASFHIWASYSYSPNSTWGKLATEFLAAKKEGPSKLKTWVNTVQGETWQEKGEAPDWERLYLRREQYPIGSVPEGVIVLTAGVDVQKDYLRYEVTGWGEDKQSWLIEAGQLWGDTSLDATWTQLDALLDRTFEGSGGSLSIALMAVDSGYNTQTVYNWCRRYPMSRVIAVKGMDSIKTLVGTPSPVDVTIRGKRMQRGYKVWPVAGHIAKGELYGWLRLPRPAEGEPFPPGWCHFPEVDEEYFRQLTAEHLVTIKKRNGFVRLEWHVLPGRQNHGLDCRVYSRVAAAVLGLDRMVPSAPRSSPPPSSPKSKPRSSPAPRESAPSSKPRKSGGGWLKGGGGGRGGRGGGWLGGGRRR